MHVGTLIKVNALNAEEGRALVSEALEESCEADGTSWDYVGNIAQVVETVTVDNGTQAEIGELKSYEELEEYWKDATLQGKQSMMRMLKEKLFIQFMDVLMSPDEAPLHLDKGGELFDGEKEEFEKKFESILKNLDKEKLSYEEMINRITDFISNTEDSMFHYYLKCINKVNRYLKYPDKYTGLHNSTDIHFYDMTAEQEDQPGTEVYYFLCDRHC